MRHHTAARRGEDGGWHYVSLNRRTGGYPLGYCREYEPHDTETEARECYAQFLRDTIKLNASRCGWTSCQAGRGAGETRCRQPAQDVAEWGNDGWGVAALCPEHMTVEGVLSAYPHLREPAGDAWVS